jgi:hypothetical protein
MAVEKKVDTSLGKWTKSHYFSAPLSKLILPYSLAVNFSQGQNNRSLLNFLPR